MTTHTNQGVPDIKGVRENMKFREKVVGRTYDPNTLLARMDIKYKQKNKKNKKIGYLSSDKSKVLYIQH